MTHKDPKFSLRTPDVHGWTPDINLIGTVLTHTGNGHDYVVTGFAWMGGTDEWGFLHQRTDGNEVICCRALSHLTGVRADGSRRYDRKSL